MTAKLPIWCLVMLREMQAAKRERTQREITQ
jgi:hypothetical protein